MTTAPARAARTAPSASALASAVAVVSLLATAAMSARFPIVPPLAWAGALIGIAVGCAIAARTSRAAPTAHLAVEPFAMALMVVLDLIHSHGSAATAATATAAHVGHEGWLPVVVQLAVAVLAIVCPLLAVRHATRVGLARGALPLVAAAAMAVMAAGMLLPH
ncbi:hypothetical protein ACFVU2_03655 [Leifsonia sp. NPDC058194]|uniref:hypothetical protein n=1 Tax=Leifsonia sp. NPDC058194 TaxID=3346374 RepID=UPI0036D832CE